MNTGGTPDIVVDKKTGLLSNTPEDLSRDIRRLRDDEGLRRRLAAAAMARALELFDAAPTTERIERLYQDLVERRAK